MGWDITGVGNALMDALVVIEDDALLSELGLTKGTMHPVAHERWQEVYERVKDFGVTFDSGGSCANTVATAGRLGCRGLYRGQVGDDQMGRMYARLMEKATGSHALRFSKDAATGKCLSIISKKDAERTMLTDLGAAIGLPDLGDEFTSALKDTRIAHFTGYTLLGGPVQATALEAVRIARDHGAMISLDCADPFVIDTVKEVVWDVIASSADLVFLNEEEAKHLTGMTAEEAVNHIAEEADVDTVVVKLGKRGSLVRHGERVLRVEPHLVDAIDTTGAGDAYAGAFLTGMARGWAVERCAQLASRVAALTVAQVGATVKDPALLASAVRVVEGGKP